MEPRERMLDTAERTTLQQLAREQLPGLYALARHLVGTDPGAEDLVQETLLKACRSIEQLRDLQAAPKWLRIIMVNLWRDRLRAEGRQPRDVPVDTTEEFSLYQTLADEDPMPYSDTMHVDFLGSFSQHDVHQVLQQLPDHFRAALVLRYLEGFDTADIADLLDLAPGTVYSHLHRGRQAFERALWDYAEASGLTRPDLRRPGARHGAGRPSTTGQEVSR
jgi:RNA polymerase sigma-70 factor, ECF subfamily